MGNSRRYSNDMGISRDKYSTLIEKYGKESSFALWGDSVYDMSMFDEKNAPWGRVNPDYILVAISPASEDIPGPLENFHSRNGHHGDSRLMMALKGSDIEGSFMTDASSINESDSGKVDIKKNDIDSLLGKINDIGSIKIVFLLTFQKKYENLRTMLREEGYCVVDLPHYSPKNGHIKDYCLARKINIDGLNSKQQYATLVKYCISEAFKENKK